jgi:glyoxylase-like metal-dependent hydrolase (beta-lactamase superfamily II)
VTANFLRVILGALLLLSQMAHGAALLKSEDLGGGVYALIGPTGPRLPENFGLNANYGVIDTPDGAILIDSGASTAAAKLLEAEVRRLTGKPVRWVVNTGSQDHRWLGNSYFAAHGAEIVALERTTRAQQRLGKGQLEALNPVLKEQMTGTQAMTARQALPGDVARLQLGGRTLELRYFASAHFPGDAVVWMPQEAILFSGDLIYVDRILGILPESNAGTWLNAFGQAVALQPKWIVPGHGRVCDIARAQRDTGDYLAFVVAGTKKFAEDLAGVDAAVAALGDAPAFSHLLNFGELHRGNVNRAYLRFEAGQ